MTATITNNLTAFLEDLKSADLVGISFIPQSLGLRLDFTYGPEIGDVGIELYRIVHLVFSQPFDPDDTDYCFWVGEVEIESLSEAAMSVLSSLSYPFTNSSSASSLVRFRLEGDICLEAVCGNYKIYREFLEEKNGRSLQSKD